jgi:hypothetical protein
MKKPKDLVHRFYSEILSDPSSAERFIGPDYAANADCGERGSLTVTLWSSVFFGDADVDGADEPLVLMERATRFERATLTLAR